MRPRSHRRKPPEAKGPSRHGDRNESRFLEELENRIRIFLDSDEEELELEPMNSYKRRLAHKLATQYKLDTDSRGEEPERYVCLIRTERTEIPQARPKRTESSQARPSPKGKPWDYGFQTFPINPGKDGVRIMLKSDGSVELYRESDRHMIVDERLVTSRQIRIRKGKIVTPDDPNW